MEFSTKAEAPEKCKSDCVVVGVYEGRVLSAAAKRIDTASKGAISRVLQQGDMEGRAASTLLLHALSGVAAPRVLLVGLGKAEEFKGKTYRDATRAALRALSDGGTTEAAFYLAGESMKDRDAAWAALQAGVIAHDAAYRFDQMKSKPERRKGLARVV